MIAHKSEVKTAAARGRYRINQGASDVIRVENVSFAYDDGLTVLDDLTLSVKPGEFVAIVGPNGAGKSTLLKIILGLLEPQRGRVQLFGQELGRFRDWWRIGYVAQRPEASNPHFPATVEEVVLLGRVAKMGLFRWPGRADRAAARRALELVGMEPLRRKMIGQLSGGQLQRVFIARALAADPELLILDEPTAGVDAESQARFYNLLKDLNDELGVALLFVSHDIGPLREMLDTVACVNRTLCYYGPPEGFLAAPEHFAVHHEHHDHEQEGDTLVAHERAGDHA
ncbi:MAG TPA: metal ABC transporter ATP-binding protein [Chloroflexia bacterium]|nr:metal ABC transporter ATP-binding protein [Chloroflexia bacterium]